MSRLCLDNISSDSSVGSDQSLRTSANASRFFIFHESRTHIFSEDMHNIDEMRWHEHAEDEVDNKAVDEINDDIDEQI